MSRKGETVNQAGLAAFFGVHRNTVAAWIRRGCPYVTKGGKSTGGRDWKFDSAAVAQWRIDEAVSDAGASIDQSSEAELDRRRKLADTTIAELKAAQARGELGSIDEFSTQVANLIIEIRQRLLQLPARVSKHVVGLESETAVKEILADEVSQTLENIGSELGEDD